MNIKRLLVELTINPFVALPFLVVMLSLVITSLLVPSIVIKVASQLVWLVWVAALGYRYHRKVTRVRDFLCWSYLALGIHATVLLAFQQSNTVNTL